MRKLVQANVCSVILCNFSNIWKLSAGQFVQSKELIVVLQTVTSGERGRGGRTQMFKIKVYLIKTKTKLTVRVTNKTKTGEIRQNNKNSIA